MTPYITFRLIKLTLYSWFFYLLLSSRIQLSNNASLNAFTKSHKVTSPKVMNILIAHPDDEVMFFAPTLSQLQTLNHTNLSFNIFCFSNGDADGLGSIRAKELNESISLLLRGQQYSVHLFDHKDGMNETWDENLMLSQLETVIGDIDNPLILTFDSKGVSGHVNHRTCHSVAMTYKSLHPGTALFLLDSYGNNIIKKYSAFVFELMKVILTFLLELYEKIFQNKFLPTFLIHYYNQHTNNDKLTFFIPFPKYAFAYATMLNAHQSQVVWFRYGWWACSRFVFVNDLHVV
ncbi:similar to Saccharomyces cerevisiae YMR281W GPI12 ER membrane protein involved in the second step of glycosylphosphatidylinositol (GPI) anchor assembly [Maudiozyma saulgeensis]|uniref:N-acetylglucosaminylphosphatidylinositol deacetylase n=1 Tax=Maudiozyma saulgeensis TaxID=1789683 RepID=A0A1X7R999_9SACH|nr:similar to Saccharomyces cerevisiae YMR281W GPI12 ER membrane protein involved in the second step of glycosylphosphatidylinositol (GPI) anchor assembly [Kazachstania saulgeensis]